MTLEEAIKTLCIRCNISVSELARRTDNTPQNFFGKIKRESFTKKDLEAIAKVTNTTFKQSFILQNGEEIF